MYDYHCHSEYSGDIPKGKGSSIRDLCQAAIEKGIKEIAVTDHFDIDGIYDGYFPPLDREGINRDIASARQEFGDRISLLHGIELGQATHMPVESKQCIRDYDYDVVIGSVHAVRGIIDFSETDIVSLSQKEREDLWERYLTELYDTVLWGDFDILAHITYPVRYYRFSGITDFPVVHGREREIYEEILKLVIQKGICLECNTSGLRQGLGETLPGTEVFRLYRSMGGDLITIGSDAHHARDLGADIKNTSAMLKELGFTHLTRIKNRKKYMELI